MVAQNMGIFHLPAFLNENQHYNYCRIVRIQSVSHFHSCLIVPIVSCRCSLVEVPNEALLYTGFGEITIVAAAVLVAEEQDLYFQPMSNWLCSYNHMHNYMFILLIWPMLASIFTAGVWMYYIHKTEAKYTS